MSVDIPELARLAVASDLIISNDDLDCTEDLTCSKCLFFNSDSNSCRFWVSTPDFIPLDTRRKVITYLHLNHPEFLL